MAGLIINPGHVLRIVQDTAPGEAPSAVSCTKSDMPRGLIVMRHVLLLHAAASSECATGMALVQGAVSTW